MSAPILATKLYIPPPRAQLVSRPRLVARLNAGLQCKLTLVAAPAGFGKTTLLSAWIYQQAEAGAQNEEVNAAVHHPSSFIPHPSKVAWLSLDAGDNDLPRFLSYLIAALQTVAPQVGAVALSVLQAPQPPPAESVLTALLNELAAVPDDLVLVLDDYHVIDVAPIDAAVSFLLDHLPPQAHLVIASRADPQLPLARLRARGQLSEVRAADLRFTPAEAGGFLNQAMGLQLTTDDIAALEMRTEGWIAGLQLAALSMQGQADASGFVKSFTGSNRFVLDYLLEEVLHQQPEAVQRFLLHTAVLERMCGPLCDAVLTEATGAGQATLEYLERSNLFLIPLDAERRWYRYHHLFADLLRQRLQQAVAAGDVAISLAELHTRASAWYEAHDLELEAFQHAAAAGDIDRAARLVDGRGMPLQFRGAAAAVLNWLAALPPAVLDARPALWVTYASALGIAGRSTQVEAKLQAAEAALQGAVLDATTRNLIGHIASIRAMQAGPHYQVETMLTQARRALEYLHPDNLPVRTAATWTLGLAYQFQGERAAAIQTYKEAIAISEASGNNIVNVLASSGLAIVQESQNQLATAVATYRRVLRLVGEPPQPTACEAYLGLARIAYQWNDLDTAEHDAQLALHLAQQIEVIDTSVACEVVLARLKLARGELVAASVLLAQAADYARRHSFTRQLTEIAAVQVWILLHQGELPAAAQLTRDHDIPFSHVRVLLAHGEPAAALALLEPLHQQAVARDWADQHVQVLLLEALALHAHGDTVGALQLLADALQLAAPAGFVRLFVDEGAPMAALLGRMQEEGRRKQDTGGEIQTYIDTLLTAFATELHHSSFIPHPLSEPLSEREFEILRLVAQGLSNREISERLFLALDTVKGHNRRIFGKLQVQRRTEAVARARELGLL